MADKRDYYEVLGVDKSASAEDTALSSALKSMTITATAI